MTAAASTVKVRFTGGPAGRAAVRRGAELALSRGSELDVEANVPARSRWQVAIGAIDPLVIPGLVELDLEDALKAELEAVLDELPGELSVRWRIASNRLIPGLKAASAIARK
jgi:hypothetical protein